MAIYRLLTLSPRPSMEAFRLRCRQALELVDQGIHRCPAALSLMRLQSRPTHAGPQNAVIARITLGNICRISHDIRIPCRRPQVN
jgi:hypothetical protein